MWVLYKMETQKIINLWNDSSSKKSKFATKNWCVMDSQTAKGKYNQKNSIKFETESIKSSVCDYSNAFILVKGDITVTADNNTDVVFKNHALFSIYKTVNWYVYWLLTNESINDKFVEKKNHIYIVMPMHNLTECSDNYSDASGCLWKFKRDEVSNDNADLTIGNS